MDSLVGSLVFAVALVALGFFAFGWAVPTAFPWLLIGVGVLVAASRCVLWAVKRRVFRG